MSTPIKPSNNATPGANGSAGSPAMNDMMSRLNAQAKGADAQDTQNAFSKWMEQHALNASTNMSKAESPKPSAQQATAKDDTQARGALAAATSEQVLARARQQAMSSAKPAEQPAANRPTDKAAATGRPKVDASKAPRKDNVAKPEATKDDVENEASSKDEVGFTTAMGEGSAVVRELTPPPSIQPGDAASMMAWLASLTNGEAAQGQSQDGLPDEAGQGDSADALKGRGQVPGAGADKAQVVGAGPQTGAALDPHVWQTTHAAAALQVDAMLAQTGQKGDKKAETDALAGMLATGGMRAGGLGQPLNEATQNVRHESSTLATPFGSPEFSQALADKVSMWVSTAKTDGPMTAELHLNPAEMGPINVKISLDGQSAQVDFAAAAVETRKAIEASLPLLSSALSDVGLNMTGGDVSSQTSQQSFAQQFGQSEGGRGRSSGLRGERETDERGVEGLSMRQVSVPRPGRQGGLDLYA